MFESLKKKLSGLVEKITKKVDEKAEQELQQQGAGIRNAPDIAETKAGIEPPPEKPSAAAEKPPVHVLELPPPVPPARPEALEQAHKPALPDKSVAAADVLPKPQRPHPPAGLEPSKPGQAGLPPVAHPPEPAPAAPPEPHKPERSGVLGSLADKTRSLRERLSLLKKRGEETPPSREIPEVPQRPSKPVPERPVGPELSIPEAGGTNVPVAQETPIRQEQEVPKKQEVEAAPEKLRSKSFSAAVPGKPEVETVPVPSEPEIGSVPEALMPEAVKPGAQAGKSFKERIFGAILETEISESDLEEIFSGLEVDLLENDVALEVTERIIADMRASLRGRKVRRGEVEKAIREAIRLSLEGVLSKGKAIDLLGEIKRAEKPYKVVFVGINGTGKTTTIAKIANLCLQNGFEPVIAASDTFRAASIEQLEAHAQKLGVKLVKHKYGADAAAVAYDAIEHARAKGKPVVLVDTAGRMQTNANLMDELRKILRVVEPNLVVFVGDSLTGNDAVEQARTFNEVRVDAVILTKSDADAKGGACLSISYAIGKPVLYLGTGQGYSDLVKFTPEWFMEKVGAA